MNKRIILVLVVVMAVASIGLIVVQAYWIQNAIRVKEQQFNNLVKSALTDVISALEANETTKQMEYQTTVFNDAFQNKVMEKILNSPEFQESNKKQIKYEENLINKGDSMDINSKISILSEDSLLYSVSDSVFQNTQAFKKHIEKKLTNKVLYVENIIYKVLSFEKSIAERVDMDFLNKKLHSSLLNKGINLDCQFAVYDHHGSIVHQSPNYDIHWKTRKYNIPLFPNDFFSSPSWLVVYFPDTQNYIRPLGFMVTSSIFLTLTIILTFSFTIYIILKQKKLSEIKNDFINNMTHELKTPISTISLASQMLKDESIPIEMKNVGQISGIIEDESKRLSSHVEKVLQMAVLDKGVKLKIKELDINEIVENICTNFSIQIESKGGELNMLLCDEPVKMMGDQVHITNIIINLLDNAVKYNNHAPLITITTAWKKNHISIVVKDNGIGISKENQKKIFEKFYRVSTGNIHNVKGFGLGLSYVKKIVDAHQGQIFIDSELNKGTAFEVIFPEKLQSKKNSNN